jgi:hypothetical protein
MFGALIFLAAAVSGIPPGSPDLPIVQDWTTMNCVASDEFPSLVANWGRGAKVIGSNHYDDVGRVPWLQFAPGSPPPPAPKKPSA